MSALGFLKRGVRRAIDQLGGIKGGVTATEKQKSQVGRWHSRNDADLPTLGDAYLLDEAALLAGGEAHILKAMAGELGHVCFRLPDALGEGDHVALALIEATGEFGDIASSIHAALADGTIDPGETIKIIREIDEAQEHLVRLRALIGGDAVRPRGVPMEEQKGAA